MCINFLLICTYSRSKTYLLAWCVSSIPNCFWVIAMFNNMSVSIGTTAGNIWWFLANGVGTEIDDCYHDDETWRTRKGLLLLFLIIPIREQAYSTLYDHCYSPLSFAPFTVYNADGRQTLSGEFYEQFKVQLTPIWTYYYFILNKLTKSNIKSSGYAGKNQS